jgi:hypothetical protein
MFIGRIEHVHADAGLVGEGGKLDWASVEFLDV